MSGRERSNSARNKANRSHEQPTIAALVKATNKLSLYPEFQDLRRVVSDLQVENLKALVAEEQSQVVLGSLGKKYSDMQRALGLLVDTVVDEFGSVRQQILDRDKRIEGLEKDKDRLEAQVSDLRRWAAAAHEDMQELRKVMSDDVTSDSLSLRRIAAQHSDLIESLRQQHIKIQKDLVSLSSSHRETALSLHEVRGRLEARHRGQAEGTEMAVQDLRHKIRSLEERVAEGASRAARIEEAVLRGRGR